MRHNDFRRISWIWLLSAVIGLLMALASPSVADDGPWDPTLPIGRW